MARKPGSMYRYVRGQPTTQKKYLGGIPNPRITQFVHGNRKEEFDLKLSLIAEEKCQIRHNSLESSRITANRYLEKKIGVAGYRYRVLIYPHVVIRENKQATGAGADRVSQGMRASYGKNVGTAARVQPGQVIMTIETNEENLDEAKESLRKAKMKVCTPCVINVEEIKKHKH